MLCTVDIAWMRRKIQEYDLAFLKADIENNYNWAQANSLHKLAIPIRRIIEAVGEPLPIWSEHDFEEFRLLKNSANLALGVLDNWTELRDKLKPEAPSMIADGFHSWVWDAAQTFWESKHYSSAVHQAATSISDHLQTKVNRRDQSDQKLMGECFSEKDPKPGCPRLRFPGDPTDETVKSRQHGALMFSQGCYGALRNPAAHGTAELDQQIALEQLAAFSVLARLIDECSVVTSESTT